MNVKDRQCLLTFLKKADGTSYYTGGWTASGGQVPAGHGGYIETLSAE